MEIDRLVTAKPETGDGRDDVLRLFAAYRRSHDPAIRETLVMLHLGLVARLVRRFRLRGAESDDLLQVGCLGLIGAIDRFDPDRGVPFAGYAVPSILGEIRRYFRDKASTIRMPRHAVVGNVKASAQIQPAAGPTVAEDSSRQAFQRDEGADSPSAGTEDWEDSVKSGTEADAGSLSVEETGYARSEDREVVRRVLHRLSPRERMVLYLRFHEGLSQAKVARRLGATQMHVCRWERRALDKLKQAIGSIW